MQTNQNWPRIMRVIHWVSAVAVVGAVGAVWGHELYAKGTPQRVLLMHMHFTIGLLIAGLTLLRVVTRTRTAAPTHPMPSIVKRAATVGHIALYSALLLLPLTGYLAVASHGKPIPLLGGLQLPAITVTEEIGDLAESVHELLATVLLTALGAHLLGVLFHARILKDKVLNGMLGRN